MTTAKNANTSTAPAKRSTNDRSLSDFMEIRSKFEVRSSEFGVPVQYGSGSDRLKKRFTLATEGTCRLER